MFHRACGRGLLRDPGTWERVGSRWGLVLAAGWFRPIGVGVLSPVTLGRGPMWPGTHYLRLRCRCLGGLRRTAAVGGRPWGLLRCLGLGRPAEFTLGASLGAGPVGFQLRCRGRYLGGLPGPGCLPGAAGGHRQAATNNAPEGGTRPRPGALLFSCNGLLRLPSSTTYLPVFRWMMI